jgi:hypothetical protein
MQIRGEMRGNSRVDGLAEERAADGPGGRRRAVWRARLDSAPVAILIIAVEIVWFAALAYALYLVVTR